jgi:crossover junction endodeoxyribonuclease RuvC
MIVLGIDPGTATTGYGLVRENPDGSLAVVDYGVVLTSSKIPMPERLLELHKSLHALILLHRPATSAVEKLYFQSNVRTALSVGQARGVALLVLAQAGLQVSEYTPLQVKSAVTGYGAAGKDQVQQMVRALLNLPELPTPDDAADALAVAICHLHSYRLNALQDLDSG